MTLFKTETLLRKQELSGRDWSERFPNDPTGKDAFLPQYLKLDRNVLPLVCKNMIDVVFPVTREVAFLYSEEVSFLKS